ncbi:DUF6517 family protein [Haloglomus halophilum]|uniref:DUF6517 family protein n=1 Tax=Haloglomus halophilum TaxID=2962672 RepID=UPI0020CA2087|nr:DUF6517 family protein [Haloglomus halophilum]
MSRDDATTGGTSRRSVLKTLGAAGAAGAVGLAGCSEVAAREYEAAPVALAAEAESEGFHAVDAGSWEETRSAEALGMEVDATLTNQYAAYGGQDAHLGLVAMPAVEEGGEALNPLAERPLPDLVDSDAARSLLRRLNIEPEGELAWRRGPERLGVRETAFLGREARAMAFTGTTGGGEEVLLHVARIRHEGDAVFGVRVDTRPLERDQERATPTDGGSEDEDGSMDSGSGGGWSPPEAWERFDIGLGHGERIDPCAGTPGRWVEITKPEDRGLVTLDGSTSGGYQFPIEYDGGKPYAEVTAEADTGKVLGVCGGWPDDFDHYEWSYRRISQHRGHCGPPLNRWVSAGTGTSVTMPLEDCECGFTIYEIRVEAYDSQGNVASSDTIRYNVNVWGC